MGFSIDVYMTVDCDLCGAHGTSSDSCSEECVENLIADGWCVEIQAEDEANILCPDCNKQEQTP